MFASRSYCEPTQSTWESSSGGALRVAPVDTHLFIQVLRPSGTGKLGPLFSSGRVAVSARMREALNDNPRRPGRRARRPRRRRRVPALHARRPRRRPEPEADRPTPATTPRPPRRRAPGRGCHRAAPPAPVDRACGRTGRRREPTRRRGAEPEPRRSPRRGEFDAGPGLPADVVKALRRRRRSSCSWSCNAEGASTTDERRGRSSSCARAALDVGVFVVRRRATSPTTRGSPRASTSTASRRWS